MPKPIQIYCMALQDRSDRVRWLLEELNVPFENHFLNRKNGDLQTEKYLQLNPMGRVPTIIDGDVVLHESGAICLYLADKYSRQKLAPPLESLERADYLKWMVFSVASLECVVARMFALDGKTQTQKDETIDFVKQQCKILKKPIEQALQKQDFLLKSGFSAADIMMASIIPGASDFLVDPGGPVEAWLQRLMNRPAAIKAKVFESPS